MVRGRHPLLIYPFVVLGGYKMATLNHLNTDFFITPDGAAYPKSKKPIPFKVKKSLFERHGGKCSLCGEKVYLFQSISPYWCCCAEVDHIIPRSRGGRNDEDNLTLVCSLCNRGKSNGVS